MTRFTTVLALVLALTVWSACPTVHAQTSYDGSLKIDELMTAAARQFDTSKLDAVLLADGMTVSFTSDGRMSVLVHRIIRLNSDLAVDKFGDYRVPFDQEHCTFTPLALRVWRDARWWNSDTSGFVETLPFALEHAYDYTGVREMMLLASGVEVPCILEIAYRIEDRTPFRRGADDLWLFSRDEACVLSWFELRLPSGSQPQIATFNGAPAAKTSDDPATGLSVSRWQMGPLDGWPIPRPANLSSFAPCLIWSTWSSWNDLAAYAFEPLAPDTVLPAELVSLIDSFAYQSRTDRELANSIVSALKERVTSIDYPPTFWWSTRRTSARIFSSSYAHRVDRVRLAGSMLRSAGFTVSPTLLSDGPLPQGNQVPNLSTLPIISLRVVGNSCDLWYYPASDRLEGDLAMQAGKSIWTPGNDAAPRLVPSGPGSQHLRLKLTYDKAKSKFIITGLHEAAGMLTAGMKAAAASAGAKAYLSSVLSGCVPGASVTEWNQEMADSAAVRSTFSAEMTPPEADPAGRIVLSLGKQKDGTVDRLPGDIQVYRVARTTPISLPASLSERTELRIDTSSCALVRVPSDTLIQNAVGQFRLVSEWQGKELAVTRELRLARSEIAPGDWPMLRALLLAYGSERNNRFYLKLPASSTK